MSGTVRDEDGNAGRRAPTSAISGHDTGVGPTHTAQTAQDGTYAIHQIPTDDTHAFPVVRAREPGFAEGRAEDVVVPAGGTVGRRLHARARLVLARQRRRGGGVHGSGQHEQRLRSGRADRRRPGDGLGQRAAPEGQRIVVALGAPIDVGHDRDRPVGRLRRRRQRRARAVRGARPRPARDGPFTRLAHGVFGTGHLGRLNDRRSPAEQPAVRFLQLHAVSPQGIAAGRAARSSSTSPSCTSPSSRGSPIGAAADTGAASASAPAARRSRGTVAPHGGAAEVLFEYGTTTGYGAAVAAGSPPAGGDAPIPLSAAVAGLQPSTAYHFRIVALRGGRRYEGADATFITAAAPPARRPRPRRRRPRRRRAGRRRRSGREDHGHPQGHAQGPGRRSPPPRRPAPRASRCSRASTGSPSPRSRSGPAAR